jgi:predicted PurR-regulated permease PerM
MISTPRDSKALRALLVPLTILAWLAVLLVAGWLLGHVAHALLILVLATVITFAVVPLVSLLSRWLPRAVAIALAYLLAFALIFGLLSVLIVTAAQQTLALVTHLPDYARRAQDLQPQVLGVVGRFGVTEDQLNQAQATAVLRLQELGSRAAADTLDVVRTVLGAIVDAVLVLMLSIYLTASGPRLIRWLREQAPAGQRRRANLLFAIVNDVVGGYIRGTFTLALLIGSLVGLAMGVLQVRYALLLGILAFFMEFVPILGVFVSGAVCVLVALFQSWILALVVLAVFVVLHVIEGDIIGPRIMGKAVGIHPAVALLALVAGTELFGFWGALFGAPIAGLIQAIALAAYREVREVGAPQLVGQAVEEQGREAQRQAEKVDQPPAARTESA